MEAHTISSNGFSVDTQAVDALDYLRTNEPDAYSAIVRHFHEPVIWSGSRFDTEAMGVDPDYSSWLIEAIEDTGHVSWIDGEPYAVFGENEERESV